MRDSTTSRDTSSRQFDNVIRSLSKLPKRNMLEWHAATVAACGGNIHLAQQLLTAGKPSEFTFGEFHDAMQSEAGQFLSEVLGMCVRQHVPMAIHTPCMYNASVLASQQHENSNAACTMQLDDE